MQIATQVNLTQEQRVEILDALLGGTMSKVIPFDGHPAEGHGEISIENTGDGYHLTERREGKIYAITFTHTFQLDNNGNYTNVSGDWVRSHQETSEHGAVHLKPVDGDGLLARLAN